MIWDLSSILTITILVIGLTARGYLPAWVSGCMLMAFVAFKAVAKGLGGISDFIYSLFIIFFYSVIVIFFIFLKGGRQDIVHIVPILIGVFGSGFEQAIAQIVKLAIEKHVGILFACLAALGLVVLRLVGRQIGSIFLYHWLFSGASIFILLTFLATSGGDWREVVISGGSLIVMLCGFYIMFYGFSSSFRKG